MSHWAMDSFRSEILRKSLESLIKTTRHLPVEIIVVDNGANLEDSRYLLDKVQNKEIQYYVRNSENLYFGYARNQGFDLSCGEYLAFSDNDIEYKEGWLDKCLKILVAFPDRKIAVTPLRADPQHRNHNHWQGELEFEGEKLLLNMRGGSNSWVMRRKDFEVVGCFCNHRVAGSKWTDEFVNKGYLMATMEKNPLATDIGFRRGYDLKMNVAIKKVFTNGETFKLN